MFSTTVPPDVRIGSTPDDLGWQGEAFDAYIRALELRRAAQDTRGIAGAIRTHNAANGCISSLRLSDTRRGEP